MQELLEWLEYLEDGRQQSKVRHRLKDILVIVLFATLANAEACKYDFASIDRLFTKTSAAWFINNRR